MKAWIQYYRSMTFIGDNMGPSRPIETVPLTLPNETIELIWKILSYYTDCIQTDIIDKFGKELFPQTMEYAFFESKVADMGIAPMFEYTTTNATKTIAYIAAKLTDWFAIDTVGNDALNFATNLMLPHNFLEEQITPSDADGIIKFITLDSLQMELAQLNVKVDFTKVTQEQINRINLLLSLANKKHYPILVGYPRK
jgi:hypothetical protein